MIRFRRESSHYVCNRVTYCRTCLYSLTMTARMTSHVCCSLSNLRVTWHSAVSDWSEPLTSWQVLRRALAQLQTATSSATRVHDVGRTTWTRVQQTSRVQRLVDDSWSSDVRYTGCANLPVSSFVVEVQRSQVANRRTDRRTDGRTDRRTDEGTDGQTKGQVDNIMCPARGPDQGWKKPRFFEIFFIGF